MPLEKSQERFSIANIRLTMARRSESYLNQHPRLQHFFGEMIGTFLLLFFGFAGHLVHRIRWDDKYENHFIIAVAFGIGALVGLSVAIRSSGGHLNPGVTVMLALMGRFPINRVWYYIIAQYSGSFLASCLLFLQYHEVIDIYVENHSSDSNTTMSDVIRSASFYTTFPPPGVSLTTSFVDQVRRWVTSLFDFREVIKLSSSSNSIQIVGCSLMVFSINCVETSGLPKYLNPVIISAVLIGVIMIDLLNAGAILNPARDLAPRVFTALVYGQEVFTPLDSQYWWLVGIVAPHLGCILGAFLYAILVDPSFLKGPKPPETGKEDDSMSFSPIAHSSPDPNKVPRKSSLSSHPSESPKKHVSFAEGTKDPAPDTSSQPSSPQKRSSGQAVPLQVEEMMTRL
ncbi:aquaporin-9-like [Brevipalpus obovatus]|uniref:aquaporin-9-like n=1 Tax=Brevipalpus obovatus TaxID=246614 RepID=UPI003D9F7E6C